jgi:hypothetical protein
MLDRSLRNAAHVRLVDPAPKAADRPDSRFARMEILAAVFGSWIRKNSGFADGLNSCEFSYDERATPTRCAR